MMAKTIKSLELHYQMIQFLMKGMIAFDEVERKPDCALWLSRGGCAVHGYMLKKSTFLTFLSGHQSGHPTGVLQAHVTASKLVPLLRHVTNL